MAMEIVDDLANDADAEQEVEDVEEEEEEEEEENGVAARAVAAWGKEYASESEAQGMVGGRRRVHQQQRRRENWVERAWEMRRSIMRDRNENRNRRAVLLQKKKKMKKKMNEEEEEEEEDGGRRPPRMRMDLEEVKACRDLGLGLPPDWTVELPYGLSGGETSSGGGNSPCGSWRISSPGDDPREVKARLKAWAHAVVRASASHLQDY